MGSVLRFVLKRAITAFEQEAGGRVGFRAAELDLSPRAALSFSLVLHELFTNALKYGALSNETGRIAIDVGQDKTPEPQLRFSWTESGGRRSWK